MSASDDRVTERLEGENFTSCQIGKFSELGRYTFTHPAIPGGFPGKLFMREMLDLTSMEVSINMLPPKQGIPFYHKHRTSEELYIFIKGKGQFKIDGEIIDVSEGTVIKVAPRGIRTWRNNSQEELYYIVIQAKAGSFTAESISDGEGVADVVSWE